VSPPTPPSTTFDPLEPCDSVMVSSPPVALSVSVVA
jgi:hypothetical protein